MKRVKAKAQYISKVAAARDRKVSRVTIYAWIERGIISVDDSGRIERTAYERVFPSKRGAVA